jgi:NADH-quinone oxidoreductase subunit A
LRKTKPPWSIAAVTETMFPTVMVAPGIGCKESLSTTRPVTEPKPVSIGTGLQAASAQRPSPRAKALRTVFVKFFTSMTPYGPVALYLLVAFIAALLFCTLPGLMARKKPNPVKSEAYECGVEPTSDVAGRFPVRFYLIAMLFVIFDVEAASFYPWAVQMHQLRTFGLIEMVSFVIVLAIGYAYVWRRGGFQWR